MIKNYLIFSLFLIPFLTFSQGSEDFSNASIPGSPYSDGNFAGNDGVTWTYVHARNEGNYPLNGNGIMLRRADEPSSLSATIPGGIGDFSVDTRKAFTGNDPRNLELVINGTVIQQFQPSYAPDTDDGVYPFIVEDINVEGDVLLELRLFGANGNQQITLDDISWTGYTSGSGECTVPTISSTLVDEICEGETASISATSDGTDLMWFDSQFNGNQLGTGSALDTEALSATTSFWVEARNYGDSTPITETGGANPSTNNTSGTAVNSGTAPWGLSFDAYEDFTLNSVDVYLTGAAGTLVVELKDASYNLLETVTVSTPAGNSGNPVQFTVPLDLDIPAGTDYKLVAASSPPMVRQFSGSHPGFPYPIGSIGSVTAGTINNSTSNNTAYYFFYNWSFTTFSDYCASDREEVIVTVNPIEAVQVSASETTICMGESTTLTVSSVDEDYSYVWEPGTMTGENVDVSPASTTSYTVTATNSNTGCETTDLILITVSELPEAPEGETEQSMEEGATLQDLTVTGTNLNWYADAEGTTPIDETTELVNNSTYYVSQTPGNCESEFLPILVTFTMSIDHVDFQKLSFYPNPTAGILQISNGKKMNTAEVYNLLGQKLMSKKVAGTNTEIDLSSLSTGTYLVKLTTENATNVKRIMKE